MDLHCKCRKFYICKCSMNACLRPFVHVACRSLTEKIALSICDRSIISTSSPVAGDALIKRALIFVWQNNNSYWKCIFAPISCWVIQARRAGRKNTMTSNIWQVGCILKRNYTVELTSAKNLRPSCDGTLVCAQKHFIVTLYTDCESVLIWIPCHAIRAGYSIPGRNGTCSRGQWFDHAC